MRFFGIVATFVAALVLAACVSSGSGSRSSTVRMVSASTSVDGGNICRVPAGTRVGTKVGYADECHHLEVAVVEPSQLMSDILNNIDNEIMREKKADRARRGVQNDSYKRRNVASRDYDVFTALVTSRARYVDECVVDIVIDGVNPSMIVGPVTLLKRGQLYAGEVMARQSGPREVTFDNVRVTEMISLRIPAAASSPDSDATFIGENCAWDNPDSDGQSRKVSRGHRLDNPAQFFSLVVKNRSVPGRSLRRPTDRVAGRN